MKDDLNITMFPSCISNLCGIIIELCEKSSVTDKKTSNKYIDLSFHHVNWYRRTFLKWCNNCVFKVYIKWRMLVKWRNTWIMILLFLVQNETSHFAASSHLIISVFHIWWHLFLAFIFIILYRGYLNAKNNII